MDCSCRRRTDRGEDLAFWAGALLVGALVVSLPAWTFAFPGGMLTMGHDIAFHMLRIEGIKDGLLAGQLPVRVNPVWFHGYGMPTGIFYPDIFLYPFAFLRMTGVSLWAAWAAFLTLANLVTAFSAWWAFSSLTRSWKIGAVAALFYLVFLYRLVDLYARAAGGEILAMAFFPGALIFSWLTLRRSPSCWVPAVLFTTCVLQSHIITSLLLLVADIAMMVVCFQRFWQEEVRRAVAKAVSFIVVLNLWFYAPLLYFHTHMDYVMKGGGTMTSFVLSDRCGRWISTWGARCSSCSSASLPFMRITAAACRSRSGCSSCFLPASSF